MTKLPVKCTPPHSTTTSSTPIRKAGRSIWRRDAASSRSWGGRRRLGTPEREGRRASTGVGDSRGCWRGRGRGWRGRRAAGAVGVEVAPGTGEKRSSAGGRGAATARPASGCGRGTRGSGEDNVWIFFFPFLSVLPPPVAL
jgi:hypothetical protein